MLPFNLRDARPPLCVVRWFSTLLLIIILLADGTASLSAAESSGPRELKRAARRLRISPERLEPARIALREGTDLALRLKTVPTDQSYILFSSWPRLNRPEALSYLEKLFYSVQRRAAGGTPEEYTQTIQVLPALLHAIASVNSERAMALIQQWPQPPELPGKDSTSAVESWERIKAQIEQIIGQEQARRDPQQVVSLLEKSQADRSIRYYDRASLANQLYARDYQRGETLIRNGIRDFQSQTLTLNNVREYMHMLQSIGWNYPDLVGDGARTLIDRLKDYGPSLQSAEPPVVLRSGDQSVQLSSNERVTLDFLRGLANRPGLLMELLERMPEFKEKIGAIGGIDVALRNGVWTQRADGYVEQNLTPQHLTNSAASNPSDVARSLREEAGRDPERVRQKLRELAQDPNNFDALTQAVYDCAWDYPDIAEEALDLAKTQVDALEPISQRATKLLNLMRAQRNLDGETDRNLLYKGFDLVRQIQEEEQKREAQSENDAAPASVTPTYRANVNAYAFKPSEQMYAELSAEWARLEPQAAISRARGLPDGPFKLRVLLHIAQALGQAD